MGNEMAVYILAYTEYGYIDHVVNLHGSSFMQIEFEDIEHKLSWGDHKVPTTRSQPPSNISRVSVSEICAEDNLV